MLETRELIVAIREFLCCEEYMYRVTLRNRIDWKAKFGRDGQWASVFHA